MEQARSIDTVTFSRPARYAAVILLGLLPALAAVSGLAAAFPAEPAPTMTRVWYVLAAGGLVLGAAAIGLAWRLRPSLAGPVIIVVALAYGPMVTANYLLVRRTGELQRQQGRALREATRDLQETDPAYRPAAYSVGFLDPAATGWPEALTVGGEAVLPLAGIANAPTLGCGETGELALWHTDRYGFKNPDEVWDMAAPFEALLVGDSYTAGACVRTEQDIAGQMRLKYAATLNLGLPGAGPITSIGVLREYIPDGGARRVFWLFYEGNDIWDLDGGLRHPVMSRYMEPRFSQGLAARSKDIDTVYRQFVDSRLATPRQGRPVALFKFVERVASYAAARPLAGAVSRRVGLRSDLYVGNIGNLEAAAKAMLRESDRLGASLTFVYIPGYLHIAKGTEVSTIGKEAVLGLMRSIDVPVVDIEEEFVKRGDYSRFYAPRDQYGNAHYTPQGYAVVGETLSGVIEADSGR